MKKKYERKLSFRIVAVSENAMSFPAAKWFAKAKGGRLPDQVEAAEILFNGVYPELSPKDSYGYWCMFRPYYKTGTESGIGAFHGGYICSFSFDTWKSKKFWCNAIVIKDVEE